MSRATAATTAGAAVALTGVLLGSVLLVSSGDDRTANTSAPTHARAELPLRQPTVAVTITARPRPQPSRTAPKTATGRSATPTTTVAVAGAPSAAERDADLAAWLAGADLLPASGAATDTTGLADLTSSDLPELSVPSPTAGPDPVVDTTSASFVVGSFNVLGSSHTRGGARGKASGVARMQGVTTLLAQHDVDVVGLQELQSDQLRELERLNPGYATYPGTEGAARDAENSVAWRSEVWEPVQRTTVAVPYFDGHTRRMPVVLLRHKASGLQAYFANFHNPADTRRYRGQQRWRTQATQTEISLVNRLSGTGIPVFVTGDMNEREEYFCAITGGTSLVAARGGSNGPAGCDARSPRAVDWVLGSDGVRFSAYDEDRSPLVDRTTDHPVVTTRATIDAATFPRSATP